MKLLLDENIDIRFKQYFPEQLYQVYTVRDMQWNGIKNGDLLRLLKEHGFDGWIVVDKHIPYQQNIATLPCAVIVLNVFRNTLKHIVPLVPNILERLEELKDQKVIVISEKR